MPSGTNRDNSAVFLYIDVCKRRDTMDSEYIFENAWCVVHTDTRCVSLFMFYTYILNISLDKNRRRRQHWENYLHSTTRFIKCLWMLIRFRFCCISGGWHDNQIVCRKRKKEIEQQKKRLNWEKEEAAEEDVERK